FYLSLDDDLMRRFASDKVKSMMKRLGMKADEAIEHKMSPDRLNVLRNKLNVCTRMNVPTF
ncbi:MAG: hypothetical protein U9R28_00650, partial [Pseudomonadota bacterium]|nr:hypothetical protein [Pseudomonadota bacterium]